ncbi:MAG: helix-turn-helix transcriptional regulator [Pseudonocardiaceae bacterium]
MAMLTALTVGFLGIAGLADRLEVSRQSINAPETGRYDPSLPLAFRTLACSTNPSKRSSSPTTRPTPPPAAN